MLVVLPDVYLNTCLIVLTVWNWNTGATIHGAMCSGHQTKLIAPIRKSSPVTRSTICCSSHLRYAWAPLSVSVVPFGMDCHWPITIMQTADYWYFPHFWIIDTSTCSMCSGTNIVHDIVHAAIFVSWTTDTRHVFSITLGGHSRRIMCQYGRKAHIVNS